MKTEYWSHFVNLLFAATERGDKAVAAQACRVLSDADLPIQSLLEVCNHLDAHDVFEPFPITLSAGVRTGFLSQLLTLHLAAEGLKVDLRIADPAELATEAAHDEFCVLILECEADLSLEAIKPDLVCVLRQGKDIEARHQHDEAGDGIEQIAVEHPFDPRLSALGVQHLTREASEHVAAVITKQVRAVRGQSRKLIVCDLDGLLWPGTLGECGSDHVTGTDDEFAPFRALQDRLSKLKATGQVQLAILSKNHVDDVKAAFRNNPQMPLAFEDFADVSADWTPKPDRIAGMLNRLNTGAGHAIFLDDNPVERAAMRDVFPELVIPECAGSPEDLLKHLDRADWTWAGKATEEDRLRKASLAAQVQMRQANDQGAGLDALGMRARVLTGAAVPTGRAVQMFRRVTQFNTDKRVLTESEIECIQSDPSQLFVGIELTDCFANHGVVALCHLQTTDDRCELVQFLMSCRAQGRGLETLALQVVARIALDRGCQTLHGRIRETPRNAPIRDLYARHSFACISDMNGVSDWSCDLHAATLWPTPHIELQE